MKRLTIILTVLGLAGFAGVLQNDASAAKPGPKPAVVDCSKGDLIADAIAGGAKLITIEGTCTENVTVTSNGITFRGNPGVGGTLIGGFTVTGAQRVIIDNLTIEGVPNGVRAQNNAHVTVRNSTIQNHTGSGVDIRHTSSGLIEGNTIGNNGDYGVLVNLGSFALLRGTAENTQTITSSSNFGCCGNAVGVFNFSSARLNGGNVIEATGSAPAISVFSMSYVRLQRGLNTVLGGTGRAIEAGRNSQLTLRWFDVTGGISLSTGAFGEIRKRLNDESGLGAPPNVAGVINGNIVVRQDAQVRFNSPYLARNPVVAGLRQGSVTVNGTLNCFGNQGHVTFDTGAGQTIVDVFPNAGNRAASQCNDFNGFVVLPDPPPGP